MKTELTKLQTLVYSRLLEVISGQGDKEIFQTFVADLTEAKPTYIRQGECVEVTGQPFFDQSELSKALQDRDAKQREIEQLNVDADGLRSRIRELESNSFDANLLIGFLADEIGFYDNKALQFSTRCSDLCFKLTEFFLKAKSADKDRQAHLSKIEYLEDQIQRTEPTVKAALGFYQSARAELGIDWTVKDPTIEEVFDKALKVLRDCQQSDKTIFELRKERDEAIARCNCLEFDLGHLQDRIKEYAECETELLAKVKDLEEDVWNNREDSKRFQKANIELSAKVADLEKQLRAAKSLPPATRPAPTMPHANAAKVLSESRTIPTGNTPPPKFIQPWTYDTSPEVIYEYVRLVVAGQSPAIAAQTAGVAGHERDKARVNFKTAIDGGKARTGVDREEFLAKQLKNWRERRDHAIAIAKKAGA